MEPCGIHFKAINVPFSSTEPSVVANRPCPRQRTTRIVRKRQRIIKAGRTSAMDCRGRNLSGGAKVVETMFLLIDTGRFSTCILLIPWDLLCRIHRPWDWKIAYFANSWRTTNRWSTLKPLTMLQWANLTTLPAKIRTLKKRISFSLVTTELPILTSPVLDSNTPASVKDWSFTEKRNSLILWGCSTSHIRMLWYRIQSSTRTGWFS